MNDKENFTPITESAEYKLLQQMLVPFFSRVLHEPFKTPEEMFEAWMMLENPMLGNILPIDMLLMGRGDKLLKIVEQSLSENPPEEKE